MSQTTVLMIVPNKDEILAHIKSDAQGMKNIEINKMLVIMSKELEMNLEEKDFIDLFEKDKQSVMNEYLIELNE